MSDSGRTLGDFGGEYISDVATNNAPKRSHDPVNAPSHYTTSGIQPIEVVEAWDLGFNLGNTVKYISRAGKKDGADPIQDLEKAAWYLNREISNRKKEKKTDG